MTGVGNGEFSPERLAATLRRKRLSQTDLAEKIGWSRDRISRYARGVVAPEEPTIEKMEAALGVSLRERRRGRVANFATGESAASDPPTYIAVQRNVMLAACFHRWLAHEVGHQPVIPLAAIFR